MDDLRFNELNPVPHDNGHINHWEMIYRYPSYRRAEYDVHFQAHTSDGAGNFAFYVHVKDVEEGFRGYLTNDEMDLLKKNQLSLEYLTVRVNETIAEVLVQRERERDDTIAHDWLRNRAGWMLEFPSKDESDEPGVVHSRKLGVDWYQVYEGHPTDEGYHSTECTIQLQEDGWELTHSTSSRDCDGPLEQHSIYRIVDGEIVTEQRWQRDAYAEQAGY